MILGTAGHVDHGKTALVKALTGVDTDRWEEEKRRGITIDLGFAPLRLGERTLGVVDVPGHEAFVRNMLAGATGLDLALLVVAADEGVMPQTREHLAILTLLGIRGGVVALTKRDLVDDDWLELVRDDVRATLAGSPLAGAALVACSAVTGEGLEELRAALVAAAEAVPERDAADLFRLPVDRVFTVRGTGTVVTGTVWSGTLERDAAARLLPGGRAVRVRGIESHGAQLPAARPGSRAAIALAGVDVSDVRRGMTLVAGDGWEETEALLAEVALLEDAEPVLGPRTRVRFHLGTADVGARVVCAGGALRAGERREARIVLEAPVVARAGDRFVLRSASPVLTIGGGVVGDPVPPRRRARPRHAGAPAPVERLRLLLAEGGVAGIPLSSLPVRTGAAPRDVPGLVAALGEEGRRIGDRLYASAALGLVRERVRAAVDEHHARHPLDSGAPLQSVRGRSGADAAVVDEAIRAMGAEGTIELDGALIRRAGWSPRLTAAQLRTREALERALAEAGREPPSVGELAATHGPQAPELLRLLEREGRVVAVESERYYERAALDGMVRALRQGMEPGREYGPPELREILGFSRKFLIPFLEWCDRTGITERRATGRVVRPG